MNEEAALAIAKAMALAQARIEISNSLIAALIISHPDPGGVRAAWEPLAAQVTSRQLLEQLGRGAQNNEVLFQAVAEEVQHWTDTLIELESLAARPSR